MNAAMKDLFNATLDIQRSEPTRVAALQKVIDVLSEEAVKKDYTTSDLDKILATVSNAQSTVYYDNTPVSIDTAFASVVERLMSTEDASGSLQTSKDLIVDAMSDETSVRCLVEPNLIGYIRFVCKMFVFSDTPAFVGYVLASRRDFAQMTAFG